MRIYRLSNQNSSQNKYEKSKMDEDLVSEEDDDCFDDYYGSMQEDNDYLDLMNHDERKDPENFQFECLNLEDVERHFNESVEAICAQLQVLPSLAKLMLHRNEWDVNVVIEKYQNDSCKLLQDARIKPVLRAILSSSSSSSLSSLSLSSSSSLTVNNLLLLLSVLFELFVCFFFFFY